MEDGSAANPFLRNVDENHKGNFGTTLGVNDDGGGANFLLFRNGGADADVVDVAEMTAQLKTTAELDYETRTEYMVTVTATDPSLASKMVYVMVTVDNVDDKAVITLSSPDEAAIEYPEKGEDSVATFSATDEDEADDTIEWGVSDTGIFKIEEDDDGNGVLSFKSAPNFEAPKSAITSGTLDVRNVYAVTVSATNGTKGSAVGESKVEVTVTDVEEEGSGKLTELQPQVAVQLRVTGFSDPDSPDGVSGLTWQWSKSMDKAEWTDISAAKGDSYTPKIEDIDYYLRAMASYSDRRGDGKTAPIVSDAIVEAKTTDNSAPDFGKQDSDGNDDTDETGSETDTPFLRTIKENTKGKAVGSPIAATDADDDVLQYTHAGTDMAHFSVDENGQLTAKVDLNFESSDGDDDQCATAERVHRHRDGYGPVRCADDGHREYHRRERERQAGVW